MKKYEMQYMYDWGSGTCLWPENETTIKEYGYPVDVESLPLTKELQSALLHLIVWHDEALNWDNPTGDLLWAEEEKDEFINEAMQAYERLCLELEDDYLITLAELI